MYKVIRNHPSALQIYQKKLLESGQVTHEDIDRIQNKVNAILNEGFLASKDYAPKRRDRLSAYWSGFKSPAQISRVQNTGVKPEILKNVGKTITVLPDVQAKSNKSSQTPTNANKQTQGSTRGERIAFRESELKLKSVLLNKELASISTSDQNVMNQKDAICCKSSAIAGQFTQVEPKDPDKKRLKVSGSYSTQYFSSGPQELPTTTGRKLSSPVLGKENSHFHNLANSKHIKKVNLMGRPPTSLAKRKNHDSMQLGNSPENIPRLQDGSLISSHFDHFEDAGLKNLNLMESNHQSNIDGSLTSTLNPTTEEKLVRTEFTEVISNHKTADQLKSAYQARTPSTKSSGRMLGGPMSRAMTI